MSRTAVVDGIPLHLAHPDRLSGAWVGQEEPLRVSQLAFVGPAGMWVHWDITGQGTFDSEPLITPARQNLRQGAIYRLKVTNIPGRASMIAVFA